MHFVVSWDIEAIGEEWNTEDTKLRDKLKAYSWVRPLKTLYIVKVDSQAIWDSILTELGAVAKSSPKTVHFIMSPLMSGGRYNGILPQDAWDGINERST